MESNSNTTKAAIPVVGRRVLVWRSQADYDRGDPALGTIVRQSPCRRDGRYLRVKVVAWHPDGSFEMSGLPLVNRGQPCWEAPWVEYPAPDEAPSGIWVEAPVEGPRCTPQ